MEASSLDVQVERRKNCLYPEALCVVEASRGQRSTERNYELCPGSVEGFSESRCMAMYLPRHCPGDARHLVASLQIEFTHWGYFLGH